LTTPKTCAVAFNHAWLHAGLGVGSHAWIEVGAKGPITKACSSQADVVVVY
jgi:hypothetical protein